MGEEGERNTHDPLHTSPPPPQNKAHPAGHPIGGTPKNKKNVKKKKKIK